MLADVVFPIFAPSKQYMEEFKKMDYDTDKMKKEYGSPFVSNQDEELKVRDGIYYTGLNVESWFREAGINICSPYSTGYEEANKAWLYREEQNLKFIPMYEIANMYKLSMFGDAEHVESGVCDNEDQILNKWSHLENSNQRHFITMTPIYKEDQPESGGWRWHKWGEYIGNHPIECEYLYDEEDIEVVYVFHIYTLTADSGLGSMPVANVS